MNYRKSAICIAALLAILSGAGWCTEYNVGAYYYPWYGGGGFHEGPSRTVRWHLVPQQQPSLGWYDDHDPAVVSQHLIWARSAGIDFFVASYWGRGDGSDWTIQNRLLTSPDIGDLKVAVFLETLAITADFVGAETEYLCDNYFSNPHYYRIDGRPVIYVYVTWSLTTPYLTTYTNIIRTTARNKGIGEVYIVGDEVMGYASRSNPARVATMNAITCYDVYGHLKSCGAGPYVDPYAINTYKSRNDEWRDLAHAGGIDFIPSVGPGFNDTAVRGGHWPMSRKYRSESGAPGSLFAALLDKAKLTLDRSTIQVTSWNEWHEDTQIEPVAPSESTNVVDGTGGALTDGVWYEGYDTLYLDILRNSTSDLPAAPTNPSVSDLATASLRFNWRDNSSEETAFRIYAGPGASPPVDITATAPANATNWLYTDLTPNAHYSMQVSTLRGEVETVRTLTCSAVTLADPPSIGNSVVCDKQPGGVYSLATAFVFTNPIGFGEGGAYKASKFRYKWDTAPTHTWTGDESAWLSRYLRMTGSSGGDYYLHLKAYNSANVGNDVTLDYGPFHVLASNSRVANAKAQNDSSPVRLGGKILYWRSDGFGYVEEPDRTCGVRVEGSGLPDEGTVSLVGTLRKPPDSEPYVIVEAITRTGSGSIAPVGVTNASLGTGLMHGLLVKTWGVVKPGSVSGSSFLLSDGSTGPGTRVVTSGSPSVMDGEFVSVTGAVGFDGTVVLYAADIDHPGR